MPVPDRVRLETSLLALGLAAGTFAAFHSIRGPTRAGSLHGWVRRWAGLGREVHSPVFQYEFAGFAGDIDGRPPDHKPVAKHGAQGGLYFKGNQFIEDSFINDDDA